MYKDYPFDAICKKAEKLAGEGFDVYQKFTCAGCGERLTMETPNHFYETGSCDKCDTITNIKERGCNFMLHVGLR